jgi:Ca-activated chloride channel family protein
MSELDTLRKALDEERVTARLEAKQAAIAAALRAYHAEHSPAHQGTAIRNRLSLAARAALETVTGRRPMRMTHALAGGASLLVLTLAVMTAANIQTLENFGRHGQPATEPLSATPDLTDEETKAAAPADADSFDLATEPEKRLEAQQQTMQPQSVPPSEPATVDARQSSRVGGSDIARMLPSPAPMMMQESAGLYADEVAPPAYQDQGRDNFETIDTNPVQVTVEEPVSTFSIDVDTASYAFMRAALSNGVLPQDDSVRVEELINYFPYDYAGPTSPEEPFAASVTVMETPWNPETQLLHIGIRGFDVMPTERPRANLVFLIDTSGSMEEPNKLPLLINSLKLLVDTLEPEDTVSIVTYAGSAGTVLEPTSVSEEGKILAALENLMAGGSTAGGEGIRQAYQLAKQNFDEDGVNRVILATDGDFNVGITDIDELQGFVERERGSGIFLSVLGFGMGNYNDALMQALAQNGNGAAAYIDTLNEARKVLVEEATSTLFPIAKDVKIQIEFNPSTVVEYRLIGYETRLLNREDFNNDEVDAGEIGSGHTVTAIYEITPAGSPAALVDDLRYQDNASTATDDTGEYAFLRIRYKLPEEDESRLIERPITTADEAPASGGGDVAREARFAAAVAAFGQILRGGRYTNDFDYEDVIDLANANKGEDEFGYRAEFVNLVRLAESAASMERLRQ